ncbi:MAG: endonuclease/exonuclease/phosphatase family protein [Marmoricola sp.]
MAGTALAVVLPLGLLAGTSSPSAATAETANGAGNLGLSLQPTPNGQIKVTWKVTTPTSRIRQWVVRTSTARSMVPHLRTYTAPAKARSLVVPRAALVTSASGDSTFVKMQLKRKDGATGYSPTKWIKAPVVPTPAASLPKVTIGTFNVRTWNAEHSASEARSWRNRRAEVVRTIESSGAGVVALQEASGATEPAYGNVRQWTNLAGMLPSRWRLADDQPYKDDAGHPAEGLQGTRILYDSTRYSELDHGVVDSRGLPRMTWTPWVELQDKASGKHFHVLSVHLTRGVDRPGNHTLYNFRLAQARDVIGLAKRLSTDGNEVFVAGDFNSTALILPNNGVHRKFVKAGFFDAFATRSVANGQYPTTNDFEFPVIPTPIRRDYIMSYGPLHGSYWYKNLAYRSGAHVASDHFMQVAQLPF